MNKNRFIITLLVSLLMIAASVSICWGQSPDISWMKIYGGRYPDEGRYLIQTDDGGYMIAGYTYETP